MDAYPVEYTNHELPLILLSGFKDAPAPPISSGPIVECSVPTVQSDNAKPLIQDFFSLQGNDHEWDSRASKLKNGFIGYKFKLAGRVGT
jgi:trafficking protein particle complex subunit 11